MPLKRYLIALYGDGLVDNLKPWLIPDKAFQEMNNVYTFRGRIRKRWGTVFIDDNESQLSSRLRVNIGSTDGGGNLGPITVPGIIWQEGQQFSVGTAILTVYQAAGAMYSTTVGVTGDFDTATGIVNIFGAAATTAVYYYPATPVMGIMNYDSTNINFEPTYSFDQQFAYEYNAGISGFQRLGTGQWNGSDANFVWGRMFSNTDPEKDWLVVVNNKPNQSGGPFNVPTTNPQPAPPNRLLDGIKYYDSSVGDWTNFVPLARGTVGGADQLRITGARICIEFKGRLLLFAPWEAPNCSGAYGALTITNSTQIDNRLRYSWQQSLDVVADPTNVDNCFFEASGKGGYIDAPTTEAIVTVQFVKDRLIVYFERSTFELAYTGAPDQPFVWQKIDTSLGAESTFSQVPFDDFVVGVGNNGIHACNGVNVRRIDEKIPDTVFKVSNINNALDRIAGIRDYFTELVYWTFPFKPGGTFPEKILVYDYKNQTWSFFDDSFTAWGYHNLLTGLIWQRWYTPWQESHSPWNTAENVQRFRKVVAGNQQGFVLQLHYGKSSNNPALTITDLAANTITSYNHNLNIGDYVKITECQGSINLNNTIVLVKTITTNTFTFDGPAANAGYTGGGILARVSQVELRTKQYNFYTDSGQQTFIPYIDFLVDRTDSGQHTVDYFLSTSSNSMIEDSTVTETILGNNILETSPYELYPFEETQDRFWHRVYFQAVGDTIQFRLYYSDAQMKDPEISLVPFVLHAMLIYADAEGTRLGE